MWDVRGKTVSIVGGSSGIGKANSAAHMLWAVTEELL